MFPPERKGGTAIENDVLAVLGIARQGPIAKYKSSMYTLENRGCTLEARASNPSDFVTAITPNTGRHTALKAKPKNAGTMLLPAILPRNGGKIKFPAPKNIENNVIPISILFFKCSFTSSPFHDLFIRSAFFQSHSKSCHIR